LRRTVLTTPPVNHNTRDLPTMWSAQRDPTDGLSTNARLPIRRARGDVEMWRPLRPCWVVAGLRANIHYMRPQAAALCVAWRSRPADFGPTFRAPRALAFLSRYDETIPRSSRSSHRAVKAHSVCHTTHATRLYASCHVPHNPITRRRPQTAASEPKRHASHPKHRAL